MGGGTRHHTTSLLSVAGFPVLPDPPNAFKGGMGKLDLKFLEKIRAFLSNMKNFSKSKKGVVLLAFQKCIISGYLFERVAQRG